MKNWSELYLEGTAITKLPSSIKYATGLLVLDLKNFRKLESSKQYLQDEIHGKPLLSRCSKFEEFRVIQGNMKGLRRVFLDGTAIKELPPSIQHLNGQLQKPYGSPKQHL